MKKALRASLLGEASSVAAPTANALARRGLWDSARKLTRDGWLLALENAPLKLQAQELGLSILEVPKPSRFLRPEIVAYEHFEKEGYVGGWCEGGPILLLIRAAAMDFLHKVNTLGSRNDARKRFTEAQLTIHSDKLDEICAVIDSARLADVLENFREIYADQDIQDYYPGIDNTKMLAIAKALTMPRLAKIAKAIGSDPYRFQAGWPDLTLAREGGDMIWAEVKTTDRLLRSQIDTMSTMRALLPGSVVLVHVS